jgi:hypothetical protein
MPVPANDNHPRRSRLDLSHGRHELLSSSRSRQLLLLLLLLLRAQYRYRARRNASARTSRAVSFDKTSLPLPPPPPLSACPRYYASPRPLPRDACPLDALPRIADTLLAVWLRIISLSAETYALVLVSAIAVISLRRGRRTERDGHCQCLDFPLYSTIVE